MNHFHQNYITKLIDLFGLELENDLAETMVATWLQKYDRSWIVKAIVESLYRGRYKIKSVDNILKDWQRLGNPRYNFTPDYEREILQNLPNLTESAPSLPLASEPESLPEPDLDPDPSSDDFPKPPAAALNSDYLNPEESTPFQYHNHSILPDRSTDLALGTIVTLGIPSVIDSDCLNAASIDDRNSFINVPTSLAILQGKIYTNSERQNQSLADRNISQPVKLQLFNTLKSIVDPHSNHPRLEVDSQTAAANETIHQYSHFHFPIEGQSL